MAKKTDEKREKLRDTLTDIAERIIASEGPSGLKARRLADEAGCAIGAIYNVFGDLEAISMAVNGRTFASLGIYVSNALTPVQSAPPTQRLITMAHAYLHFAAQHPRTWRALFTLRMSTDMSVPQWYLDELERLFSFISGPISECFPNMPEQEVALMTRALFSSVHGMVLLGLENRISAVPQDQLETMISMMLTNATRP